MNLFHGNRNHAALANKLGCGLRHRFEGSDSMKNLDEAIDMMTKSAIL